MASVVGFTETTGTNSGSAASVSVTRSITAGNTVLIFAIAGAAASPIGSNWVYSGDVGSGYAQILAPFGDTAGSQWMGVGKIENHPGGSTVFTVTFDIARTWRYLCIVEINGATGIVGQAGLYQATPGTSADAVTSGNITNSAAGLLVALSFQNTTGTTPPSLGTGFTDHGGVWDVGGGADTYGRLESKSVSSTAAGTFTSTNASWAHVTSAVVLSTGGPTITGQPSGSHVAEGATAALSVTATASGGGTLSYQWQKNSVDISGATSASYTTPTLTRASDDGNVYRCNVTETGGSNPGTVASSNATVRVGLVLIATTTAVYSASGGSSVAPTYPALQANDLLILEIGMKPSSANSGSVTTPSGWNLDASRTGANDGDTGGYTTTLAADTGNCNIWQFSKVASGSESGTLSVTIATNNVSWATIYCYRGPPGSTYSVASVTGKDTSAGNLSITGASDPGVTAGDYVLCSFVQPTDVSTPTQFSAEAITQTGVTFGTVTEYEEPDSTTGNDIGGLLFGAPVNSGTSSTAPTFTATAGGTTTNVRGPGIFTRIRAAIANLVTQATTRSQANSGATSSYVTSSAAQSRSLATSGATVASTAATSAPAASRSLASSGGTVATLAPAVAPASRSLARAASTVAAAAGVAFAVRSGAVSAATLDSPDVVVSGSDSSASGDTQGIPTPQHAATRSLAMSGATVASAGVAAAPSRSAASSAATAEQPSLGATPARALDRSGAQVVTTQALPAPSRSLAVSGAAVDVTGPMTAPSASRSLATSGATVATPTAAGAVCKSLAASAPSVDNASLVHSPARSAASSGATVASTVTTSAPAASRSLATSAACVVTGQSAVAPTRSLAASGATLELTGTLSAPAASRSLASSRASLAVPTVAPGACRSAAESGPALDVPSVTLTPARSASASGPAVALAASAPAASAPAASRSVTLSVPTSSVAASRSLTMSAAAVDAITVYTVAVAASRSLERSAGTSSYCTFATVTPAPSVSLARSWATVSISGSIFVPAPPRHTVAFRNYGPSTVKFR